ncbi:PAS domain S-box-containing protein [Bryocella elongata]|uniref:histidine kinase n=1 Tax=Bryocella elongata TaxID=863522 RepID=A0A1H5Y9H3_9BACT|nr:ATP-binding protein [Bryocella elongata]SEG20287.1 PAS domain S-box-containing protein [Bryocella elongata]
MQPSAPDVLNCVDEPIRVPGSIQQHGFFLLTLPDYEVIVAASENSQRFLNVPLRLVVGSKLDDFFEREVMSAFRFHKKICAHGEDGLGTYLGTFRIGDNLFSAMTHCIGPYRALEFEQQESVVGPETMNAVITNFVSTLNRLRTEQELCDSLTRQFSQLTGFDRVMLYSFDAEGHGTVLSEINNGRLPSYLGLAFPASDIPAQARDLYVQNTVRIIPDANYVPSPLVGNPSVEPATLDLSLSVLRSVSPIHLQYMRNMGTMASMSVSLVLDGKLWGLISGHNAEPKLVPYLIRSACDMLSRMGATQLNAFRASRELEQTRHFHSIQRRLLTLIASEPNYLDALGEHRDVLMDVTNAQGIALLLDGSVRVAGITPPESTLHRLAAWLDSRPEIQTFFTSHLAADLPPELADLAEELRPAASGLLLVRISSVRCRWVVWFRPEVISTIAWAGNPADADKAKETLTPRASFGQWKEIVRGRSREWTQMEIDSAEDFRAALTTISLRRAEEAIEEGEARFHRLTQALPIKIFTVDDDGALTYVNDRWREAGLCPQGNWFEEPLLDAEDAAGFGERWEQAVQAGTDFEAELRLASPSGGPERWNYLRITPFQRAGSVRVGWIGSLLDLTERKERETAMRMSEKLALTGRMTSVIAHEINNPLEAITNLMYLLREEFSRDGNAGTYIAMVESELERISGITKQTLRWNRETSDVAETCNAGAMVDEVLRLFAGKIRNRQIRVTITGDRSTPLRGFLGQLRQVLANLVSNAIDASPIDGKGTVIVELLKEAAPDGTLIQTGFSVCDNGRGIDAATKARLFEPFHSTKGDLGNGLGLYISREIVERHHGRILVETAPGEGTRMTVWLPA